MDVVAGLQECLGSMLASFERSVGFAEGVVMSFDPDVMQATDGRMVQSHSSSCSQDRVSSSGSMVWTAR
jgi:hypothetical protein